MSIRRTTLVLLLAAVLCNGCILVAGAGAGYIISKEVNEDDVYVAEVAKDVEVVWAAVGESLEILCDVGETVEITEGQRIAKTKVNGADVVVEVVAFDIDRTMLRVRADKPLTSDGHTAELVQRHILDRLRTME